MSWGMLGATRESREDRRRKREDSEEYGERFGSAWHERPLATSRLLSYEYDEQYL